MRGTLLRSVNAAVKVLSQARRRFGRKPAPASPLPIQTTELQADVTHLRKQIEELNLVRAAPIPDGFYSPLSVGEPLRLYHGAFNVDWLAELGLKPTTILDVGSYDGGDAIRFKQAFPQARVVAFEADPDRFAVMVKYCERFGVELNDFAVLDRDGPVDWFGSDDEIYGQGHRGSQGSIYRQNEKLNLAFTHVHQSAEPTTIMGVCLSSFCRRANIKDIDLLHMDVQGAEYEVIRGLREIRPRVIYLEMLPEALGGWIGARSNRDVHHFLSSLGYILAGLFGSDRLYAHYTLIAATTNN